jgi:hypothetical protein
VDVERSKTCRSVESVWRRAEQFNAVTAGTAFLAWVVLCPLSVLLLDGEITERWSGKERTKDIKERQLNPEHTHTLHELCSQSFFFVLSVAKEKLFSILQYTKIKYRFTIHSVHKSFVPPAEPIRSTEGPCPFSIRNKLSTAFLHSHARLSASFLLSSYIVADTIPWRNRDEILP